MTKRKKVIFAFIVVIIAVLLFSVVGVGVIYLGGGQQAVPTYPDDAFDLNDVTIIPSVVDESDSIEIEPVVVDAEIAEGETDAAPSEEETVPQEDETEEGEGEGESTDAAEPTDSEIAPLADEPQN